jgi:hypothetical protein
MTTLFLLTSIPDSPPIFRRELLIISSGLLLLYACYFGSKLIDCGQKALGRTFLSVGFGLFWASLVLGFLSGFTWTWGWWL